MSLQNRKSFLTISSFSLPCHNHLSVAKRKHGTFAHNFVLCTILLISVFWSAGRLIKWYTALTKKTNPPMTKKTVLWALQIHSEYFVTIIIGNWSTSPPPTLPCTAFFPLFSQEAIVQCNVQCVWSLKYTIAQWHLLLFWQVPFAVSGLIRNHERAHNTLQFTSEQLCVLYPTSDSVNRGYI